MYLLKRMLGIGSNDARGAPQDMAATITQPRAGGDRAPTGFRTGELLANFGRKGHGKGQMNMPCGVAVTKEGRCVRLL